MHTMRIEELADQFLTGKRAPPDGVTSDAAAIALTASAARLDSVAALHVARAHVFLGVEPSQRAVISAILALPDIADVRPPGCRSTSTTSSDDDDEEIVEDDGDVKEDGDVNEDDDTEDDDDDDDDGSFSDEEDIIGNSAGIASIREEIADLAHSFNTAFAISQVVSVASMLAVTAAIFGVWRDVGAFRGC